jgi:hypothetical protein
LHLVCVRHERIALGEACIRLRVVYGQPLSLLQNDSLGS